MHDTNLLEHQIIAWTPTPEIIERAQLTRFIRQVGVSTWDELYQYSIRDVEKFTEEVIKFLDIKFDPPYEKLLDTSGGFEFPKWFSRRSADTPVRTDARSADTPVRTDAASASEPRPENSEVPIYEAGFAASGDADKSVRAPSAGLNITTMCLDRWQTDEMKDQPALICEREDGQTTTTSYAVLQREVESAARGLKALGFTTNDAIGIHLPMAAETVIGLLAINRIGAIAVPVFSGYGVEAIGSRLNAVGAKGLFTSDGFARRGKLFNAFDVAKEAVEHCPTIQKIIVVNTGDSIDHLSDRTADNRYIEFEDLITWGFESPNIDSLQPTSAEDPLIILYTSGTTGKPKGIAHTHASFPIKSAQDMAFGTDVGKGARICWYTDIGWMMGPWLIYGALINGATICIYDGAPDYPTPDRMWEFCARHKVEVLGISPTLVRSLAAHEQSADTPVRMSAKHEKNTERKGWSRKGRLPHYDGDVTQFVTFRLADSLPKGVVERLKIQIEHGKLKSDSDEYRQIVEEYLDQGAGECLLNDPGVADIVRSTLIYEDKKSCDLKAWVIMPNHVHLLMRLRPGCDLSGFMKRVKGVSARKINQLLGRAGSVWQEDYFDRYIRDGEHFVTVLNYIRNNPVAAKLANTPEEWQFGSASSSRRSADARSADTPVRTDAASASEPRPENSEVPIYEAGFAASGDADKSVRAPFERHDLSALRILASTGEPWNPGPWWWLFEKVGNSRIPIINYSGGTEIAGGILMGNPLLPIKPCSFSAPCPGMDVDILDENGRPVKPGEVGELVIKQPWIGMARGFWKEKERYLETYWSRFKNIWVHGDWAMRDDEGFWYILGRSDDTLKVAGKRVGPAEVESILVSHPLVAEAAVIGVPDETKGTAMIAFVVRSGDTLVPTDAAAASEPSSVAPGGERRFAGGTGVEDKSVLVPFEAELRSLVAKDMGKPLAPSRIHFVSALPKTRNAKVMRRVIRAAYLGEDAGDLSALENPAVVEEIKFMNNV